MIEFLFKAIFKIKELIVCYLNVLKRKKWWKSEYYVVAGTAAINECRIEKKVLRKLKASKAFRTANYCHPSTKVIFNSKAKAIKIKLKVSRCVHINHMALNGTCGIDIYEKVGDKRLWRGCFAPRTLFSNYIICALKQNNENSQYEIIFPSFARVLDFKIYPIEGIIYKSTHLFSYTFVCYGSSITQGCASSRPGLSYANLLGEYFNAEIYNFGFSSAAHGEIEIADYISKLPMDIFIMEFDHNATLKELREKHYSFYRQIRKNTSVPIIMFSRISGGISNAKEEQIERNTIIRETYIKALAEGDRKIFLIFGDDLINSQKQDKLLSDNKHPNDYGMKIIAEAIGKKIKEILNI